MCAVAPGGRSEETSGSQIRHSSCTAEIDFRRKGNVSLNQPCLEEVSSCVLDAVID